MMRHPLERRRRAAAAMLLGALLLYVFGAAVDPIVHLLQIEAGSAALVGAVGEADTGGAPSPAGAEHDCVACKLARAHALPAAGDVAFAAHVVAASSPAAGALLARAPPAFGSLQARAPPHS
jgi:hypothetical protein